MAPAGRGAHCLCASLFGRLGRSPVHSARTDGGRWHACTSHHPSSTPLLFRDVHAALHSGGHPHPRLLEDYARSRHSANRHLKRSTTGTASVPFHLHVLSNECCGVWVVWCMVLFVMYADVRVVWCGVHGVVFIVRSGRCCVMSVVFVVHASCTLCCPWWAMCPPARGNSTVACEALGLMHPIASHHIMLVCALSGGHVHPRPSLIL